MGLLDFLFPKYCVSCKKIGAYVCANCFTSLSFDVNPCCAVCAKLSIDGVTHPVCQSKYSIDGVFSSIAYKGIAKKLMYNFKYKPYLADLKGFLVELLYESIIQKEGFYKILKQNPLLVPIPLYTERFKKRGYNQAEYLAEGLGNVLNLSTQNVLQRVTKTHSQVGLGKKERTENIKNAFEIIQSKKDMVNKRVILLVDDVVTTGATLLSAAAVLKKNGAQSVLGVTLAKD